MTAQVICYTVDPTVQIEVIAGAPPVDQSSEIAALTQQVADLTAQNQTLTLENSTLTTTNANLQAKLDQGLIQARETVEVLA